MVSRLGLLCLVAVVSAVALVISGCSSSGTGPSAAAEPGDVFGYVMNAMSASPIEGATVVVEGESTVTDTLGYYIVEDVGPGSVTVEASITDFVTVSSVVDVGDGESVRQDCALIPTTTGDEYRIVLSWGEDPSDLDSHLWVPLGGTTYAHVYYGYRGSAVDEPYAELDVDDVTGYGPETVTVFPRHEGEYVYSVYHYSGLGTLRSSNAVVRIYQGNTLRYTLDVADETCGDNWWWNVCTFDAQSGDFTIVDALDSDPPIVTSREAK